MLSKKEAITVVNKNNNKPNVLDVANYIIIKFKNNNENLTHMKLHKLIYYSYVKYLIEYKKRLILERPKAWKCGPVFGELYFILKDYFEKPIVKSLCDGRSQKIITDGKRKKIIDEVLLLCKNKTAIELSNISHQQTPWDETYHYYRYKKNDSTILDEDLKNFFSNHKLLETIKEDELQKNFKKKFGIFGKDWW
ncbi:Phage-Associated Protein [Strawberry lethal yellows phytoplasma (CPA) str. NZSb11]|uniref:Phage-Associated Protein n=1 Tax=Strawberry lethal yellows phytoplasma (CPA) str. NZSb11 TaxID=980422 RepID=R4S191_PHYAS|nr:Phage-Associated Protein [Strawberry lethal yellows phytoplasma (CPA) str. NZSb11]